VYSKSEAQRKTYVSNIISFAAVALLVCCQITLCAYLGAPALLYYPITGQGCEGYSFLSLIPNIITLRRRTSNFSILISMTKHRPIILSRSFWHLLEPFVDHFPSVSLLCRFLISHIHCLPVGQLALAVHFAR
jgi:hypothetical protein